MTVEAKPAKRICPVCKGVGCVGPTQDTCLNCNGTGAIGTMTNREILDKFTKNYPGVPVSDYRPLSFEFIKEKPGIVIWTDNHDVIAYFPASTED